MQISTGFRSCSPSPAPWPVSQHRPAEAAPADKAQWFVEHYPKLTQLSDECIDSQGRHLCLWQGPAGLLATVYDSRHQIFQTFSGSQIRNGLHPQEPSPRLQARLARAPGVPWDLVLLGDTLYVWPRLRAAAWQDFIPTDGTVNQPRAAFEGTHTLMQAMGVLYKEGFQPLEEARVCIQYQGKDREGRKTVVTELKTTHPKLQKHLLNDQGKILAVSLYDRRGNTKAGIEFRHPQDTSQTTFHADFSEDVAHVDVRAKENETWKVRVAQ